MSSAPIRRGYRKLTDMVAEVGQAEAWQMLVDGDVFGFIRDDRTFKFSRIPAVMWANPIAENAFRDGLWPRDQHVSQGEIFVTDPSKTTEIAAAGDKPVSGSAPKLKPGHPGKHDWEGILIEMARILHNEGMPRTQAEMVKRVVEWHQQKHGITPDVSDVKKREKRFRERVLEGEN